MSSDNDDDTYISVSDMEEDDNDDEWQEVSAEQYILDAKKLLEIDRNYPEACRLFVDAANVCKNATPPDWGNCVRLIHHAVTICRNRVLNGQWIVSYNLTSSLKHLSQAYLDILNTNKGAAEVTVSVGPNAGEDDLIPVTAPIVISINAAATLLEERADVFIRQLKDLATGYCALLEAADLWVQARNLARAATFYHTVAVKYNKHGVGGNGGIFSVNALLLASCICILAANPKDSPSNNAYNFQQQQSWSGSIEEAYVRAASAALKDRDCATTFLEIDTSTLSIRGACMMPLLDEIRTRVIVIRDTLII